MSSSAPPPLFTLHTVHTTRSPCRFELLCRIRIARGFGTLAGRRQLVKQRLLAFNVLLQCSPTAGEPPAMQLYACRAPGQTGSNLSLASRGCSQAATAN